MKATIQKSDLIHHGRRLNLSRPTKSVTARARVEISASLGITIMGPGFSEKLDGPVSEWGTLVVPYLTWERVLKSLKSIREEMITLSGIGGMISFGPFQIKNNEIRVIPFKKLLFEIPPEAGPAEILRLVLHHGPEKFHEAGLWSLVESAAEHLRKKLDQACSPLAEFGCRPADLVGPVSFRLGTSETALSEIVGI
jgi:hypothetical protein